MSILKKNGWYVSEPVHWEDFHAGHKFEGVTYYIIKFGENYCWIDSVDDRGLLSSSQFISNANKSTYSVIEDRIEITLNPNTEFALKKMFKLISSDILMDDKSRKYSFNFE